MKFLARGFALVLANLLSAALAAVPSTADSSPLVGSWALVAAYEVKPDGIRVYPYGDHPAGLLMVDGAGRYSLQIFHPDRPKFASGDKWRGSAEESRAAVECASTHFGCCEIDVAQRVVVFRIERALFPNLEGASQRRSCRLTAVEFSYQQSPSANGNVPVTVWRRIQTAR